MQISNGGRLSCCLGVIWIIWGGCRASIGGGALTKPVPLPMLIPMPMPSAIPNDSAAECTTTKQSASQFTGLLVSVCLTLSHSNGLLSFMVLLLRLPVDISPQTHTH